MGSDGQNSPKCCIRRCRFPPCKLSYNGPFGWMRTFVYPSILLSNFSYAIGASSIPTSCDTTKLGFALPAMMRSRRYLLYALTLHWPGHGQLMKTAGLVILLTGAEV